jgi:hypothetical protein
MGKAIVGLAVILVVVPDAVAQANKPDLKKLLGQGEHEFTFEVPATGGKKQRVTAKVTDVKFDNVTFGPGFFSASVTGTVQPFAFAHTTDANGPPMSLRGTEHKRMIMYPLKLGVRVKEIGIKGDIVTDGETLSGTITVSGKGEIEIGVPDDVIPGGQAPANVRPGRVGWEYKTWDKPADGVRMPQREDLAGCPEFIHAHAGPINGRVFLKNKSHAFTITGNSTIKGGTMAGKELTFQFDKPFVACPEDYRKAMRDGTDWDYAMEATGLFSRLIKQRFEKEIAASISTFTQQPFPVSRAK